MQKNAWTYSLAGAVLGTFGLLLRWLQCQIIFDETGLPVKNAAVSWLLVAFIAVMTAVLWWLSGRMEAQNVSAEPEEAMADATREAKLLLALGAAAILLGSGVMFLRMDETVFRIAALAGLLSAPVMLLYPSLNRWGGFGAGLSVLPVAFFSLWMISFYKTNAVNPIVWTYAVEILAIAGCLLAAYRCSAFLFYRAEPRKSIFGCALATAFSLMVLMDNLSLGERIMFAGWAICFGTLCWIVLHSAAPGKEETQPVQIAGNDK